MKRRWASAAGVAALAAVVAVLVPGHGSGPQLRITHPKTFNACAAQDCYTATLSWGDLNFPATTGYLVTQNGVQQADVTTKQFTFTSLDCATTYTLGVQPHNAGAGTGSTFTTNYATSPCPTTPTIAFDDEFASDSVINTAPSGWALVDNTVGNSGTYQCDAASADTLSGGTLRQTMTTGSFTCPGPTAGTLSGGKGIASCPSNVCSASVQSGEVQTRDFAYQYGTLHVSAKTIGGNFAWPAVWLLGYNCQHPAYLVAGADPAPCAWDGVGSEEIDVPDWPTGSKDPRWNEITSTTGSLGCNFTNQTDASLGFHDYELDWTSTALTYKQDGVTKCTLPAGGGYTPSTPMFIILTSQASGTGVTNGTQAQYQYVRVTTAGPYATALPSISGSTVHGSVLTAVPGTWTGSPTFTYQWMRCDSSGNACSYLTGSTSSTYTTVVGDVGHQIEVLVRGANGSGTTQYGSSTTAAIS